MNSPSFSEILIGGTVALLWSYACLFFAGYLRLKLAVRTGYTRKVFHVLIFISAVLVHAFSGFLAVCLFGSMVSIVVGHAVVVGPGSILYEAIARERDGNRRTQLVIIPYFATLIGGLTSSVLFGPLAIVGYLVGGLGDAAGEPIGTRWGRHHFTPNRSRKTYEGSIGVVIVSALALVIATAIRPEFHFDLRALFVIPLIALVCGFVEALSPRGWDNVPMQIVPTVLAAVFLVNR
jgi:phytol kinase